MQIFKSASSDSALIEGKSVVGEVIGPIKTAEFVVIESSFKDCRFDQLNVGEMCFGAGIKESYYENCIFNRCKISSQSLGFATFNECEFNLIEASELFSKSCQFIDCVFSGRFEKGYISGSVDKHMKAYKARRENKILGNDFSKLWFGDFSLRGGADLKSQNFGDNDDILLIFDIEESLDKFKKCRERCGQNEIFDFIVEFLNIKIRLGEQQMLLSKNSFSSEEWKVLKYDWV